jgi:hypothetical protein
MLLQHLPAVRVVFNERDRIPIDPPGGKGEAADAAEKIEVAHRLFPREFSLDPGLPFFCEFGLRKIPADKYAGHEADS